MTLNDSKSSYSLSHPPSIGGESESGPTSGSHLSTGDCWPTWLTRNYLIDTQRYLAARRGQ